MLADMVRDLRHWLHYTESRLWTRVGLPVLAPLPRLRYGCSWCRGIDAPTLRQRMRLTIFITIGVLYMAIGALWSLGGRPGLGAWWLAFSLVWLGLWRVWCYTYRLRNQNARHWLALTGRHRKTAGWWWSS